MEEKTITISSNLGRVRRERNGSIRVEANTGPSIYLGMVYGSTAREYAHAILELIGDPVPCAEPKGDALHIAVVLGDGKWWLNGEIKGMRNPSDTEDAIAGFNIPGEFHIFRRVATVSPIPQPERKVTRYE